MLLHPCSPPCCSPRVLRSPRGARALGGLAGAPLRHDGRACLRHAELADRLRALEARHRGRLALEAGAAPSRGGAIHLLTLGRGDRRVLLWSQMHGDEPSATPGAARPRRHPARRRDPAARDARAAHAADRADAEPRRRRALRAAQRAGHRRQPRRAGARDAGGAAAQAAARPLLTPSSASTCTTRTGAPRSATPASSPSIALLAVAGDPQGTLTPGPRAREARRVAARADARPPFVPGGVARYDEDWNPRAFGDNLTAWGTPVVLIESGGRAGRLAARRPHAAQLRRAAHRADALARRRPRRRGPGRLRVRSRRNAERQSRRRARSPAAASRSRRRPTRTAADVAFDVLDGRSAGSRLRAGRGRAVAHPRGRRCPAARRGAPASTRPDACSCRHSPLRCAVAPRLPGSTKPRSSTSPGWGSHGCCGTSARRSSRRRLHAPCASLAPVGPRSRSSPTTSRRACCRSSAGPPRPSAAAWPTRSTRSPAARWRPAAAGRPLGELLSDLAADPRRPGPPAPLVAPDQPASVLLLRPLAGAALDPAQLQLEAVFIDGREPAAAR